MPASSHAERAAGRKQHLRDPAEAAQARTGPIAPTSSQPATTTSTQSRWSQAPGRKPVHASFSGRPCLISPPSNRLGRRGRDRGGTAPVASGARAARDVVHAVLRQVVANELAHHLRGVRSCAEQRRSNVSLVSLDGAIIRIDPHSATGAAAPGNPLIGSPDPNKRRIVGYGLRNPFRFAFRPGTNDLWIGDVGYNLWEELDRLPTPTSPSGPTNFGWPCFENLDYGTYYNVGEPALCASLHAAGTVTPPVWAYRHGTSHMVAGDACATGGGSISGVAFYSGAAYPTAYQDGLFIADYTRRCIAFMPAGAGGCPTRARSWRSRPTPRTRRRRGRSGAAPRSANVGRPGRRHPVRQPGRVDQHGR